MYTSLGASSLTKARVGGHTPAREGVDPTELECARGYAHMVDLVESMGFETVHEKNTAPTQCLDFLGGGLDTNTDGTGKCSKFVDEGRRDYVTQQCLDMEHNRGRTRVSKLASLLGVLSFVATLVDGTRMYLRSGFDLIRGKDKRHFVQLSRPFRMDLAYLRKLLTRAADARTMLTRRVVTSTFSSWDASTGWGLGCFFDGMWVYLSWEEMLRMPNRPHFYPQPDTPSWHINYMELFAAYWFLKTWGHMLRGVTLVCHTDNTATEGMLKRMTGTATFIPLLKEILLLLVKHDIALAPVHISSKDNVLSDCLSRGAMAEFHEALHEWSGGPATADDHEDWQLDPVIVHDDLEDEYGLFDVDTCVDELRTNAHCARSWNRKDDCRKQNMGGLHVFMNGPFSELKSMLEHFVECKRQHPMGTSGVFVVPLWPTADFWLYVVGMPHVFRVVRRWPAGTELFTSPIPAHKGGGRRRCGPTRWPVVALRVGPGAIPI